MAQIVWNQAAEKKILGLPALAIGVLAAAASVEAKRRSPVKTGNNRRSISWGTVAEVRRRDESGTTIPGGVTHAVWTESGYGGFLETGTRKMAARPYIRPALEMVSHNAQGILRRDLRVN